MQLLIIFIIKFNQQSKGGVELIKENDKQKDCTECQLKQTLGNYFFVDSLIDYFIYGVVSCGLDAFGKNQLYFTYDGVKWIASMYDMDSTWGLYWNGSKFVASNYAREQFEDCVSQQATGEGNLLYVRLAKLFYEEIKARYAELKNGVLSVPSIINHFERFTDIASLDLVKEDYASTTGNGLFTSIPSKDTNNIQQIRKFVVDRYVYCDEYFASLGESEPDIPEVTLSSISAIYTGGDVPVGTALNSLTGITVTAHYSDGSTSDVTGYTLSGTIAEGNNTITVSFNDKTSMFEVTGVKATPTGPLHPFENGTKTFSNGAVVEITDGNRVHIHNNTSSNYNINVSHISKEDDNLQQLTKDSSVLFSLKNGDVVRTITKFGESSTFQRKYCFFLSFATGTENLSPDTTTEIDNTITIAKNVDVQAIGFYVTSITDIEIDIEIEIYVNGVRYV